MRKLLMIGCAVLLACGCAAASRDASEGTVRIVSFNVHHCGGMDGVIDYARTAAAITNERPDFVGLQELDVGTRRSGGVDQPARLAQLTGYHATFARAIPYRGGAYGVAVLSREKPLAVRRLPLEAREPRVLLLCEFADFWFGTVHFDARRMARHGEQAHLMAVPRVREEIAACARTKPVLLTGDWNATPDEPFLAEMRKFMKILSDERLPTNGNLKRCIDYVAVDAAHADRFAVKEARVTIDKMTSDHKPVVVTVSAPRGNPPSEKE